MIKFTSRDVTAQFDREIYFLIKPTRRADFPNLFCQETLHVSVISSAHRQ